MLSPYFKRTSISTLVGLVCAASAHAQTPTTASANTATSNQLVLESATMDLKVDPCTDFLSTQMVPG